MLGPLQFLTQILWVQANAPESVWLIFVALIGASRGLGALTFGLYGGALADRYDRRKLLIGAQIVLGFITCAIAGLMMQGSVGGGGFVIFFFLTFWTAGLQAIDAPTRLAIVPDILGPELTPAGMSLNQVAVQIAMPIAMFATGFIIHAFGFGGAYLVSVVGHLLVLVCLGRMHYQPTKPSSATGAGYAFKQALLDVRKGLRYARGEKTVLWVTILLVLMMGFGFPATANLGPTWINTVVGVPIKDLGFIVMNWGIGSLLAALFLTYHSQIQRRGRLIVGGAVLFSVSFVIFVFEPTVANVVIGNLGLGAGMTIASVSSTILIQQIVPNEVRGRVMSIFQLNMGFAQLMTMPVAIIAQYLTLALIFPVIAVGTLVVVLLVIITQRQIIRA